MGWVVSCVRMCGLRVGWGTFRLDLLAAFIRDVMLARFSVSCFARWGLMCISSAIVDAVVSCRAGGNSRRQVGVIGIKNALVNTLFGRMSHMSIGAESFRLPKELL